MAYGVMTTPALVVDGKVKVAGKIPTAEQIKGWLLQGCWMKKRVLFLCTANSCRSQMAEGIANHFWGNRLAAFSAGTQASFVNPTAIAVLKEIGIDISKHRSKNLFEFDGQIFDHVITLCGDAHETCPLYIGGTRKTHIGFDDPAKTAGSNEEIMREFRRVRDEIKDKLTEYFSNTAQGTV